MQTDIYALTEFSPRKGENISKGYLQGRYGAIPFIGGNAAWQNKRNQPQVCPRQKAQPSGVSYLRG